MPAAPAGGGIADLNNGHGKTGPISPADPFVLSVKLQKPGALQKFFVGFARGVWCQFLTETVKVAGFQLLCISVTYSRQNPYFFSAKPKKRKAYGMMTTCARPATESDRTGQVGGISTSRRDYPSGLNQNEERGAKIGSGFIVADAAILGDSLTRTVQMLFIMAAPAAVTVIGPLVAHVITVGAPPHLHFRPDIAEVGLQ